MLRLLSFLAVIIPCFCYSQEDFSLIEEELLSKWKSRKDTALYYAVIDKRGIIVQKMICRSKTGGFTLDSKFDNDICFDYRGSLSLCGSTGQNLSENAFSQIDQLQGLYMLQRRGLRNALIRFNEEDQAIYVLASWHRWIHNPRSMKRCEELFESLQRYRPRKIEENKAH